MSSVVLGLIVGASPTWAACESNATNQTIALGLERASGAYESLDVEAFEAAISEVSASTDCLAESISTHNAAELHRMRGLAAFLEREKETSRASFAAARHIEPDYTFPDSLVPEGNPVRDLYSAQDPSDGVKRVLPFPKDGTIRLDGKNSFDRNLALPVVFQRLDSRGAIAQTSLIEAGDAVPEYEAAALSVDNRKKKRRTVFYVGAASVGVLAGGAYAGSWISQSSYSSAVREADTDKMKSLKGQTNTLTVAAGGLTAVAAGLGTVGFLSGRF